MSIDDDTEILAFNSEDSLMVSELTKAVRGLAERTDLEGDEQRLLRTLIFGMERLPHATAGLGVRLALKMEMGGESNWVEIHLREEGFTLGQGSWEQGDAHSEVIFEVGFYGRSGNPFEAFGFASRFTECAKDACRVMEIEETTWELFDDWNLPKATGSEWGDLNSDFR